MAITIQKNANLIVKDDADRLIHIFPKTKASLVSYGEETTVAGKIQAIDADVSGKAPLQHPHGEISSDGRLGSEAGRPLITGENGLVSTGSFGSEAGTFAEGNDSRLSDARQPLPHEQASSTITSLNEYQKAALFEALSSSDTLNEALGKLEKGLEGILGEASRFSTQDVISDTMLQEGAPNEIAIVSCTGEVEVTVPQFTADSNPNPTSYWIRNAGGDAVTVACGSNVAFDGSSESIVLAPGESVLLYAETDGAYSVVSDGRWKSAVADKQDVIADLDTIRSNAAIGASLEGKVNGIENGAQANVIESVAVNGAVLPISGKKVDVPVPTGSDASPLMAGDADSGTSSNWSRSDHVHPSDTSKVDVVAGKGLSTNDLTDELLEKLEGVEEGAQANVIEGIAVNGVEIEPEDGTVGLSIPLASNATPLMAGIPDAGEASTWSRSDHVHPSDTSKVDAVEGKGLSENDFTDALFEKLEGIEESAQENVIETISVNGEALGVSGKEVEIEVPLPSDSNPLMAGTPDAGAADTWSRSDHVHPSDTSKVDVVAGKGLSTNDLTDELLDKLEGVESGSQENVIEGITVNGNTVAVSDKIAAIEVPAASDSNPLMNGTAAAGESVNWSRSDHVHPSDTSKVDAVEGKGLSTNDFTDALLEKLEGVESGSQENVIETISVNGTELSVTDKGVNISIDIPEASDDNPLMSGTADAGEALTWSRSDHVHPSDTSKVDVVAGKGLSENDFTDALLDKLEGIEEGAQENVLESITVNGVAIGVSEKSAAINIPLASDDNPLMAGTPDAGEASTWSRSDHVHPSDTSKVDVVEGKGLSANDFTDELLEKLESVESGSQENVIETISVNGEPLTASEKGVDIDIPLPSNANPLMAGTPDAGEASTWSRSDHVHPSDTSKVDVVEGKGLSANDFTDELLEKLEGIEDGANDYVLPEATSSILGGVTVGSNIGVIDGTISVADASTYGKGVVQLTSAIDSSSDTMAATPYAVKLAYDLANGKQSPATSISEYGIEDAYTKTEIDQMLDASMHYTGSVLTASALPESGCEVGDLCIVEDEDKIYIYTGVEGAEWVAIGSAVQPVEITSSEIDSIFSA